MMEENSWMLVRILRASLVIDDVCLYKFAGTSLIVGLKILPPRFSFCVPMNALLIDQLAAVLNKSRLTGC